MSLPHFDSAVPHLKDVRDSVAHFDERSRGRTHKGQIKLQPAAAHGLNAPGGILGLENLHGNQFHITAADGHYRAVTIDEATVKAAAKAVQDAANLYRWTGAPEHLPYG
jgi:hypothetical protein